MRKCIGSGSTRIVFGFDNNFVLKMPKRNQKVAGDAQNRNEYSIYMRTKASVLAKVDGWLETELGKGLLMERLQPIEQENRTRIDFSYFQQQGIRVCVTEEQLQLFAEQNGLSFNDLLSPIHWGISKDGALKLFDYGWTAEVCRLYQWGK
ncbi:serine/threonine protein kinase [Anoxybacillus ayderensis G10]|nr:serine/threonine protein kinase [Anoxybacillus ayderensis G10]